MSKKKPPRIRDSLTNTLSELQNSRNAISNHRQERTGRDLAELSALFSSNGLCRRIVDIKAGYALSDSIKFTLVESAQSYNSELASKVLECARYMVAFGRGAIALTRDGENLAEPFDSEGEGKLTATVFAGNEIFTTAENQTHPSLPRYRQPTAYQMGGVHFHYSRVVDFTWVKPSPIDLPIYNYGGMSEFEICRDELILNGIITTALGNIVGQMSTFVRKIDGFHDALRAGQKDAIINAMSVSEVNRGLTGSLLIDGKDDVLAVSQTLTGLSEVDQSALRRLSMVTGIIMPLLIGENVKGLNATGDNERQLHNVMVSAIRNNHLKGPLTQLFKAFRMGDWAFSDDGSESEFQRADRHAKIIANAAALENMGLDGSQLIYDSGIIAEPNGIFQGEEDV